MKLLLQRGTVCDTDKYEGARCIYGALTDSIRNLLISYDISKAVDTNLPFASHLRSLLGGNVVGSDLVTEDVLFIVQGKELRLHRFMLSCRSRYFRERLQEDWQKKDVIQLEIDYLVFKVSVSYLYLIHDASDFERVDKRKLLSFVKELQLEKYIQFLEEYNHIPLDKSRERAKAINQFQISIFENARNDFQNLVQFDILANKVIITDNITDEIILSLQRLQSSPDIILSIEEDEGRTVYYPVHRSVLIRDDYFKVMFSSSFAEAQDYETTTDKIINREKIIIPVISLPVPNQAIAEIIIKFLYYDHTDIPFEHALDVLDAGDLLLNDRLKTMASVVITTSDVRLTNEEVYEVLRAGWETRMERLEHFVAKLIALNFDRFSKDPKFHELVKESAERIQDRHETDTIELIDDIRFYLAKKWKIDFDGLFEGEANDQVDQLPGYDHYQRDLGKVEDLLYDLQLDA